MHVSLLMKTNCPSPILFGVFSLDIIFANPWQLLSLPPFFLFWKSHEANPHTLPLKLSALLKWGSFLDRSMFMPAAMSQEHFSNSCIVSASASLSSSSLPSGLRVRQRLRPPPSPWRSSSCWPPSWTHCCHCHCCCQCSNREWGRLCL